ncbi:MAG: hypothetical protein AAFY20_03100 [Cyanobacteria bacterium J06639_14]
MSTKLDYVQQLEAQIATTKSTLEKLKAEREEALLSVQHEEIEHLEKYLDQADVSLKDVSAAADDAWQELKESLEYLMSDIRDRLKHLLGDSDN